MHTLYLFTILIGTSLGLPGSANGNNGALKQFIEQSDTDFPSAKSYWPLERVSNKKRWIYPPLGDNQFESKWTKRDTDSDQDGPEIDGLDDGMNNTRDQEDFTDQDQTDGESEAQTIVDEEVFQKRGWEDDEEDHAIGSQDDEFYDESEAQTIVDEDAFDKRSMARVLKEIAAREVHERRARIKGYRIPPIEDHHPKRGKARSYMIPVRKRPDNNKRTTAKGYTASSHSKRIYDIAGLPGALNGCDVAFDANGDAYCQ